MAQHKWHKEIKAWADGAEIEVKNSMDINQWILCVHPNWSEGITKEVDWIEYRIKPQPKNPQYLYVYKAMGGEVMIESKPSAYCGDCIGKIKLEVDDD